MSLWRSPLMYLGIVLILLAGAALTAPLYIDWNSYRSDIEDYGRQLTGRKVFVGGDVKARVFPWPVMWLHDVRIENPPGAKVPQLMRARSIEIRLALAPLISGDIVFENVRIDKPEFAFERLATGRGTWQFEPRTSLGDVIDLNSVNVTSIEVVDGTMILADGRRGGSARLEDVDLELSAPTLVGPWRLKGDMSYGAGRISANITTGKIRRNSPLRFAVRLAPVGGPGLIYDFDGSLDDGYRGIDGELKIKSAREVKSKDEAGAALHSMAFKASLVADFDTVTFKKVEIAPDDVTEAANLLTGEANVKLGSTIVVGGALSAARIDLDELTGAQGHRFVFSGQVFPYLAELLGTLPRRVEGNVKLDVTSLQFGGELLDGVKIETEIEQDRLRIRTLEASMPGQTRGKFSGSFVPAGEASQLTGDVELTSISARDWVNWVASDYKSDVEKVWSGARGKLELKGKIDVSANRTRLSDGSFVLDDATGVGNFLVATGDEPAFSARLVVDDINLDRYAPGGLTTAAVTSGKLAGAIDLATKAIQVGDFGLKLQADYLTLHGVTAEDIAIDIAANADGIEFRTVEIGGVGDARLDVAGLLNFPDTGVSGAITADVSARDPRGLLRLLGIISADQKTEPGWLEALGPLDINVTGEAKADDGVTDGIVAIRGLAGVTKMNLRGNFKGSHKNWTAGELHVSGDLESQSAQAVALLVGLPLVGKSDSPVRMSLTSTGVARDGLAAAVNLDALGGLAQYSGKVTVDEINRVSMGGRLAVLAERAGDLYDVLGFGSGDLSPAAQVLSGEGELTLRDGRWQYTGISGTAAGTAYRGDLDFAFADDGAHLQGRLDAGRLQLPWLLQLAMLARTGGDASASSSFDGTGGLPRHVDLQLSVSNLAMLPGIALKDAKVSLKRDGSVMTMSVGGYTAEGEPLAAAADFRWRDIELEAAGNLSGTLNISDLLQTVDGVAPLSGTVELSAKFAGQGRSPAGLLTALTGEGTYKLATPVLARLDPLKFSEGLKGLRDANDLDSLIGSALTGGDMPFAGAEGRLTIENGVVSFAKLPILAQGAKGHLRSMFELSSGQIDVSVQLELDALEGLPAFEVAYAGHPKALEASRDLAALKSFIGVNVLQQGLDRLEELQREADRLFREEMEFARDQVKDQLKRETERRARQEEQRRNTQAERLQKEVEARVKAEEEARRLARELEQQKINDENRRREEEIARKLEEEEARRLQEQAESRTRLEKHIRRLLEDESTLPRVLPNPSSNRNEPTSLLNPSPPVPERRPNALRPSASPAAELPTVIIPGEPEPVDQPAETHGNTPTLRPRADR